MKLIGRLLLYVLIACLVVIFGFYFLLQTRWGADHVSNWVSENSGYHLTFDVMDHRFSAPSHLLLENVTFGRDGQPATLVAKTVDIGLSIRQLTAPLHVDTILLQDGTLNISVQTAPFPFEADRLQLRNMALNSPGSEWRLSAQRVNGGVMPWRPEAGRVLGNKAQIQLSAGSLTLNDVPATNVLIEGSIDHDQVMLNTVGADMARGALTGVARRNADGSWVVENLRLNDIRLQSDKSLSEFFAPLTTVPSLQIGRLEVTDSSLQGPDWAVTDLDLSLRNLTLRKEDWQSQEGKLSMNASEFIYGSLHLLDPILNAEFSPQGVALRQFTTRWEGGMVRTSGAWLRESKALILDDTAIAGLEYTLPENWKQLWMKPLPDWLNSLTLKKFSASRNLVIDIDPAFPWQITALDGYGANLELVQHHQWGVWSGNATLNAAAATFNRVDVRRPSLSLTANASTVNISDLSAFTEKGILEATASVSQLPQRQTQISLNGRGVPMDVLQQWGWPALPIAGDGNIQLTASGNIQADAPLKPTVNGQLHAVNAQKQQITQTMQAGVVSGGEVTSTEPAL
ncbi:AsmA family protein [Salmonella enterica subsp. enterica serovar Napoli]|uniref:AsmA family protein n=1 Tax=Salmonella enterica subsp. enterica serovar Napoli TaxID=1151001 RepID=A0A5I4K1Q3_SALET|nr:AsmA family protein [Salmonella enterica]EAC0522929.1 AsmA family protein [Salmonella enterica subsp. enterica serovar Zaiman]EBN0188654.1 AsmA family protein [Salmonella enterica subsp. enterica serovar Enteritidis]ECF7024988.1 AsmA family protein [Salmonella enterica subsp. enterica]ECY8074504.1 AsmA family protein [Salmonella enterica subsp. enterica serovar Vitkin]EDV2566506.1 AsmA family protein [Salmonella enterica subsp. enterica serovar Miami]EDW4662382.1 AsmA family protein [Salmo